MFWGKPMMECLLQSLSWRWASYYLQSRCFWVPIMHFISYCARIKRALYTSRGSTGEPWCEKMASITVFTTGVQGYIWSPVFPQRHTSLAQIWISIDFFNAPNYGQSILRRGQRVMSAFCVSPIFWQHQPWKGKGGKKSIFSPATRHLEQESGSGSHIGWKWVST